MEQFSRFVGIWMMFVIYIAMGVEGVAHGGTCANDAECTEANNVCTSSVCACSDASFQGDGSTICTPKIALTGACTATPTGQCADANAECHAMNLICVCTSNYFTDKNTVCASQVALNSNCDVADTAPDQCSIANSACRDDGDGTDKCLCEPTYYETGGECIIKVGLDGACDVTDMAIDQCSVVNTECRDDGTGTDKCLCIDTHYSDGTDCQTKVAGLNTTCDGTVSATNQCSTAGTECKDDGTGTNRCLCKPTYSPVGSTCVLRSGVIKVTMLQYMYVVPFIVSMMIFLR